VLESDATGASWSPRSTIQNRLAKTAIKTIPAANTNLAAKTHKATKARHGKSVPEESLLRSPCLTNSTAFRRSISAATPGWPQPVEAFSQQDQGASWQGGPVMGWVDYLSVAAHGSQPGRCSAAGSGLSTDAGQSWRFMGVPATLTRIHSVAFSADGTIWLGARERRVLLARPGQHVDVGKSLSAGGCGRPEL